MDESYVLATTTGRRPSGPVAWADEVPFGVERHKDSEGKTKAWHLVFEPTGVGDLYLDSRVEWDDSPCGERNGWWSFHSSTLEVEPPEVTTRYN